jgi:hypothetical protein
MKTVRDLKTKAKAAHPLEWLLEPLEELPTYLRKKMFGCEAVYLEGKLMVVLAAGEEPWNGLMVATYREFHPSLCEQWGELCSHPVLGKWLYLSQSNPAFESIALAVVESIRHGDGRIGVEPKPRSRRRKEAHSPGGASRGK